jgi:hypothetical protein
MPAPASHPGMAGMPNCGLRRLPAKRRTSTAHATPAARNVVAKASD